MTSQGDKDVTLQGNVQTDDTASQSVTSGFMDVPDTLFQTAKSKNDNQFDNWIKNKEEIVKEHLKGAEELKKNQMDYFKDMVKGMQEQFTNFLEASESKMTSFFSAPPAHSTPIASNFDPFRLPPPLQSKDNKKGSQQENETPQRPDAKQKSRPTNNETASPAGFRPFDAELRVIEQRESSRQLPFGSEDGPRQGSTTNVTRNRSDNLSVNSVSRSSGADSSSMHPRAKLPTYDGKEEFDVFIVPFERMAERYNWSEQEKIDKVYECLKGKAMWYMCSLPKEMLRNFDTIKDGLMKRFGRKDPPTTVRRKLSEIRQRQESNEEFGEEIRRLVTRAYPGVDLLLQDQLAAEAFLKGYKNSKIAYDVLNKKPTTLNEAIELVTFQEHNFKATVGRDQEMQRRDKTRRVSWFDEEDSDSELKTQRVKAPTYVSLDSLDERLKNIELMFLKDQEKRLAKIEQLGISTAKTKGNCFNCNSSGHFAKECPSRSRSPSPKPTSRSTTPPGKNINCTRIPNQGRALRVPVKINDVEALAVIDTGADATVVSEEVANRAGIIPDASKQVRLLNATNNSEMSAFGGVTATIQMGDKSYNWKIFIAPIRDPILLGIDFMKKIDATIHTGQGNIEVDGQMVIGTVTSDNEEPYACSIVKAASDIIIPAASERIVIGRVVDPAPDKQAVLEVNTLPGGIQVGSCLVNMNSKVPVRLLNLRDHDVTIKRDFVLGKLTEAEDQLPEPSTTETDNEESESQILVDSCQKIVPEHLKELFKESVVKLSGTQKQSVADLLSEYADIFAKSDFDLGKFTAVQHQIDTSDAKPVRQPARRTPLGFMKEEEEHLKKLLDKGIVVPSKSNWASPVVLVRKKDGSVRWCVDYRRLNQLSTKDAYPIPKIDECLDTLSGATLFSTLDLMWGYHQIEVAPDARPKTAFITKYGLFEFTRMPFGLSGAPSTFQRVMELVLQGLQWTSLLIYLDDVIVTGKDFNEHLDRLREVFERFRLHGLKLKAKKCQLFQTQVLFLGHIVSCEGVSTNPEVVMDVVNWPTPRSVKELQAFLGLSNYYRRFINGYAQIAA
ncbi:hypothetical protein FSP39_024662 [Pinctada imbricata]|uniref:Uncharacterized protein n=1 Tax=Pinctada imbricata TaxID=66713 RepID=A0AA89C4H4_PINIB|nr:hypothetical protein FSP39_024662 [Pinctada imbricata]